MSNGDALSESFLSLFVNSVQSTTFRAPNYHLAVDMSLMNVSKEEGNVRWSKLSFGFIWSSLYFLWQLPNGDVTSHLEIWKQN